MTQSPREILTVLSNRRRNSDIRADDKELGELLQTAYEAARERETGLREAVEVYTRKYTDEIEVTEKLRKLIQSTVEDFRSLERIYGELSLWNPGAGYVLKPRILEMKAVLADPVVRGVYPKERFDGNDDLRRRLAALAEACAPIARYLDARGQRLESDSPAMSDDCQISECVDLKGVRFSITVGLLRGVAAAITSANGAS